MAMHYTPDWGSPEQSAVCDAVAHHSLEEAPHTMFHYHLNSSIDLGLATLAGARALLFSVALGSLLGCPASALRQADHQHQDAVSQSSCPQVATQACPTCPSEVPLAGDEPDEEYEETVEPYEGRKVVKVKMTSLFPHRKAYPGTPYKTEADVDVDGDGTPEAIRVAGNAELLELYIGTAKIERGGDSWERGFAVVDLEPTVPSKEVVVLDHGPSDDPTFHFFRYAGNKIREIGTLAGNVSLGLSGTVYVRTRADCSFYWTYMTKHRLRNGRFIEVRQPYYSVDERGLVSGGIELLTAPRVGSEKVARLALHTEAQVLVCQFLPHDEDAQRDSWCLVQSSVGLVGWTKLPTLEEHLQGPPGWYAD